MSDDPQQPEQPSARRRASDVLEQYGGDAIRMSEKLADVLNDNHKLRETKRDLTAQLETLKAQTPTEGALVLSKDDAARWQAYQALGTPDDLGKVKTEAQTATERLAALEREATLRQAAEAHGYKAGALAKLPSLAGQAITIKDVPGDDGTAAPRAFVGETPLPDYITQHDADLLPALMVSAPQPGGTHYPRQATGDAPKPVNAAQAHIQRTKYAVPGKTDK